MEHKTYTKGEVERFLEDDFIDFDDVEIEKAIETIATKLEVTMEVVSPFKNNTEEGELIIKIKLRAN